MVSETICICAKRPFHQTIPKHTNQRHWRVLGGGGSMLLAVCRAALDSSDSSIDALLTF